MCAGLDTKIPSGGEPRVVTCVQRLDRREEKGAFLKERTELHAIHRAHISARQPCTERYGLCWKDVARRSNLEQTDIALLVSW